MNKRRNIRNSVNTLLIKTIIIIFFAEFMAHEIVTQLLVIPEHLAPVFDVVFLLIFLLVLMWFWALPPLRSLILDRESEFEVYNNALAAHVIISKTDLNGKITYVNQKFKQISGYSEQELLGQDHRLLNSGHHSKDFFSALWKELKAGKVWHGQIKNKAKDGSYYWVDTILSPLVDSNGVLKEFLSIRRDITQEKIILQETTIQKVFYETILNSMEQAFIIKNKSGEIEHFNMTAFSILGLDANELNYKINNSSSFSFTEEDETPLPLDEYPGTVTLNTGLPHQKIIGTKRKDGSTAWLQTYSTPFKTKQNCLPESTLITFLDITTQIQKKKLLAHSESRLQEAQQIAQIGSWSINLINKDIFWSQQMYEIFPIDPQKNEINYEECFAYIFSEDRVNWGNAVNEVLKNGSPQLIKFSLQNHDKLIWVEARCQARSTPSGATELYGTCQNITTQVELEQALGLERIKSIQSSKLASLGEISASIAHEINNPLAIVSGIAQLFPKIIHDPEKLISRTEQLNKAVLRIATIIQGLKKYSRRSSNDNKSEHEFSSIIEDAISLCSLKSKRHDVTLTMEIRSRGLIFCDAVEIEQVLINLISNAIDAVKNFDLRRVNIQVFDEGFNIISRVSNNGTIPDNIRKKIFEAFFTTKPMGEGTGLGLSISRDIITNHQGLLTLLNDETTTCFEIKLPKFFHQKANTNEA